MDRRRVLVLGGASILGGALGAVPGLGAAVDARAGAAAGIGGGANAGGGSRAGAMRRVRPGDLQWPSAAAWNNRCPAGPMPGCPLRALMPSLPTGLLT